MKITPGGIVKVLDFGLAKLAEPVTAVSGAAPVAFSISPTITSPAATGLGVVLGTAAYMSPEQAKGRPADRYSDMWAFGAVLFEMLTGRRAFDGEDMGETLAEVIKANVGWEALPPETPPSVARLLKRCLVKDRKLRIADAGVARLEIDEGLSELRAPSISMTVGPARSRWYALIPVAAAVAAAVVTGVGVWEFARPAPLSTAEPTRFTINLPDDVRVAGNTVQRVDITRDGRRLIYNGIRGSSSQLYVRALDQLQSVPIPGVEGLIGAIFLSPDGEWVGFNDVREAKFKKVRVSGGPPATICDNPVAGGGFRGASWGSKGTIVFATSASPALMQVSDAGGRPQPLTTPENGDVHAYPQFLPDGDALLFTISGQGVSDRVAVLRLDDRQPRVLLAGSSPRFSDSGHIVFLREQALWAVPFDRARLAITGAAVPVLEGISIGTQNNNAAVFDIAANGTLVYSPAEALIQLQRSLVWVDRQGREEPISAPPRAYTYTRLSPDGTRLALDIRDQENDIWIWSIARGTLSRFTFDRRLDRAPEWTTDGRRVVFESDRSGNGSLFWQSADGTGEPEQLVEGNSPFPSGVSPDGTRAIFFSTQNDVMSVTLDGTRRVEPLVQTPFNERNGTVSPDGRWMAYQSNASGRPEIYVRPYPNVSTGQWQVSASGGTRPLWAHSGRELFYLAPDGAVMRVAVETTTPWTASVPTRLFAGSYLDGDAAGLNGRSFDISLDDRRFLMIKDQDTRAASGPSLIVAEHWAEELKKLAK